MLLARKGSELDRRLRYDERVRLLVVEALLLRIGRRRVEQVDPVEEDEQTDDEYEAYKSRAAFFNATARTADGFVGMIFRRAPLTRLPDESSSAGKALARFAHDVDMRGTSLIGYAKNVVTEVIAVGRAGTLVDWEDQVELRAYAVLYSSEQILNWRTERVNGRNVLTLLVLREPSQKPKAAWAGWTTTNRLPPINPIGRSRR